MKKILLAIGAAASALAITAPASAQTRFTISIGSGGYYDDYPSYSYGYRYPPPSYDYGYPAYGYDAYDEEDGYGYSRYDLPRYSDSYDESYDYAPAYPHYYRSRPAPGYRCGSGTTGAIVGGAGGALIGRAIARGDGYYSHGSGTVGAIIGGAAGALVGREVARSC